MTHSEMLKLDVQAELEWEPSLDAGAIGVAVSEAGAVTLTGHVSDYAGKVAAELAAKRVSGVVAVANDIEVHPATTRTPDDTDIAAALAAALRSTVGVPDTVQAVVTNGWVTLTGVVEWDYQRRAAESAARGQAGVLGVVDEIEIRQRTTAAEVRSMIEDAFSRSALVDPARVKVEVADGRAILSGVVMSWAELEDAERAAWSAPGITAVDDRLTIQPLLATI